MAVVLSQTYDALVAAGTPEAKARAAAEELAGYESRFVRIEPASRYSNGCSAWQSPGLYPSL